MLLTWILEASTHLQAIHGVMSALNHIAKLDPKEEQEFEQKTQPSASGSSHLGVKKSTELFGGLISRGTVASPGWT